MSDRDIPPSQRGDEVSERNLISEKKILAIKLLETYWQWEYELGVSEKIHKLTQAEEEAITLRT